MTTNTDTHPHPHAHTGGGGEYHALWSSCRLAAVAPRARDGGWWVAGEKGALTRHAQSFNLGFVFMVDVNHINIDIGVSTDFTSHLTPHIII